MAGFSEKFDDNQALLLFYVSGEMPPAERQQVDRRLQADFTLQAQLVELQVAHAVYLQAMKSLADATPPALPEEVAGARASRATRQWAARRLANPPAPPRLHILPSWFYPLAAAAALLVALTVWGVHKGGSWNMHRYEETSETALEDKSLTPEEQEYLLYAVGPADTAPTISKLDEADRTIASLQQSDDNDSIFLGIGDATETKENTR